MFCSGCGQAISDEAIVCSYCGRPVTLVSSPIPSKFAGDLSAGSFSDFAGKKLAAGICGIFLGAFGVHKFILGQTKPALIMLISSLCCIGYPVMHVIGIIEGIIYLTKSDREFYQIYEVEKKEWF